WSARRTRAIARRSVRIATRTHANAWCSVRCARRARATSTRSVRSPTSAHASARRSRSHAPTKLGRDAREARLTEPTLSDLLSGRTAARRMRLTRWLATGPLQSWVDRYCSSSCRCSHSWARAPLPRVPPPPTQFGVRLQRVFRTRRGSLALARSQMRRIPRMVRRAARRAWGLIRFVRCSPTIRAVRALRSHARGARPRTRLNAIMDRPWQGLAPRAWFNPQFALARITACNRRHLRAYAKWTHARAPTSKSRRARTQRLEHKWAQHFKSTTRILPSTIARRHSQRRAADPGGAARTSAREARGNAATAIRRRATAE